MQFQSGVYFTLVFFFFNDTATTEIYTLSLHDALPILLLPRRAGDDEWEDPRAELVRRLLEYQQIRGLVDWMQGAAARRARQFGRGFAREPAAAPPAPPVIELRTLLAGAGHVSALALS